MRQRRSGVKYSSGRQQIVRRRNGEAGGGFALGGAKDFDVGGGDAVCGEAGGDGAEG
jgi:hypothetical protein